ncbi:MAG: arginine--tRNA ligase [Candidatus Micrarchaeia archaeon]
MNPYASLKSEFISLIINAAKELGIELEKKEIIPTLSIPKEEYGDLSSSIAFRISREKKMPPHVFAKELINHIKKGKYIKEVNEFGGYLNAFVNETEYAKLVIESIANLKDDYGRSEIGKGKKVIIEYPSVNPNKPWHIGHLKNALLGDSVARIFSFCSYIVERENYIDDLGLQVAESFWGYTNLKDKPDKKFDQWVGEEYVKVNNMMEEKNISSEINGLLKKIENPSSSESKLCREFAEACVKAQYETAFNYRCYHNILAWESDILGAGLLDKTLDLAKACGVVEKPSSGDYANCLVANLEKLGNVFNELKNLEENTKVIVRSNGTATYFAKDLAFHMWKFGIIKGDFKFTEFIKQPNGEILYTTSPHGKDMLFGNADIVINIIGSAQQHEQLMLKAFLSLLGHEEKAKNLIHLSYGEVKLESGSLQGRSGGWIGSDRNYTADDLLSEVKAKAMTFTKDLPSEEAERVSKEVALGAIKFEFLKSSPEKKTIFSWEKALSFDSNSGPYCMYTYARASKILEKAGEAVFNIDYSKLTRGIDFNLIKLLGSAPDYVEKACIELRPNLIADYLLELSSLFSSFYETMPVLKGDAVGLRLSIVRSTRQVLKNMLLLLGIIPLEKL